MIGTTLSHYRITAKLGEGGMGEVYLAEDTELDRQVALKVLPQEMAEDPERLERFKREAKAVAALNHPNIVTIHSIEEADGRRFLTMELVEGESLDRVIPAEGLPLPRIFDIAVPISEALTAAHEKGIVHRDLKPANVMVMPDGRVKVLDFGLAKIAMASAPPPEDAATEAALTGEGTVMGTAPYMSPEQLQGQAVDHRTDIFSLGILLYEMATGQRPFQGDSGIALASSILKDSPSGVTEVRTDLPRHLGRIVHHCLEKEPRRRFQSALDVRNELDSLREEVESGASAVVSQPTTTAPPAPATSSPSSSVPVAPVNSGPVTAPHAAAVPDTTPQSAVTSGQMPAASSSRVGQWAGIAAVLLVVAAVAWWMGRGGKSNLNTEVAESTPATTSDSTSTSPGAAIPAVAAGASLVVLPFTDMSPSGDQEYFTDGLTIELINQLSQIEDLRVIGRRSAFQFKGSDETLQSIGQQLNVGAVLEGSVRKAGDQVRITAELVNTTDEFQIWSETYDRTLEDIFTIQDEIANSVAQALQVTLLGRSASSRAADLNAHTLMLQARFLNSRSELGDTEGALEVLEEALEIDPDAARIWADHGLTLMRLGFGTTDRELRTEHMETAFTSLNKALSLDPELAVAHSRIGWLEISYRMNFAAAEVATRRALELEPNTPVVLANAATVASAMGRTDEAIEYDRRVMSLEPMDLVAKANTTSHLRQIGELDEAESLIREVIRLSPDYFRAQSWLAGILLAKGQPQAALQEISKEKDPASQLEGLATIHYDLGDNEAADQHLRDFQETYGEDLAYNVARIHAFRGEVDEAFQWLEVAYETTAPGLPYIRESPYLVEALSDDPRWPAFLKKMGFAD